MKKNLNPSTIKHGKIDVVVKYFYPVVAGIEINVQNVYGFMEPHGWDISIHVSDSQPGAMHSLPSRDQVGNLKVFRTPWHWYGFVPNIDWKKSDLLALHNFDIFPHSWILVTVLIRRLLGLRTPKVFLTPHGGYTPEWRVFPLLPRLIKHAYHKTLGKYLINAVVDGYRSVSKWEAQETIKYGVKPEIIYVIHNGLESVAYEDIDKLASKKAKQLVDQLGSYLVQVGRIHPIKNQLTTIKALALLPEKISFAIIGPVTDLAYRELLVSEISRLGLEKRVHFLDVISGVDKYYFYKHCLTMTHMAIWESYCNVLHESMSQGCVSIVSRGSASEELIQNNVNGFSVGEYDYQEVAEKVKFILEANKNASVLKTMRQNNLAYTQGHSWQEISEQVENVYLKLTK